MTRGFVPVVALALAMVSLGVIGGWHSAQNGVLPILHREIGR